LIEGAVPKVPESLSFVGEVPDRAQIMEDIRKQSTFFKAGDFLERFDMASFVAEVDAYRDELFPMIQDAIDDAQPFNEFHARVWPMLYAVDTCDKYRHVGAMFQVATVGMLKLACYYLNRIEDVDKRRKITVDFYRVLLHLHERMIEDGRTVMDEARIMVEGGPEPEWTQGLPTVAGTTY
jgi:hypothetical protein